MIFNSDEKTITVALFGIASSSAYHEDFVDFLKNDELEMEEHLREKNSNYNFDVRGEATKKLQKVEKFIKGLCPN